MTGRKSSGIRFTWQCMECGKRASMEGCPGCGGVDIDIAAVPGRLPEPVVPQSDEAPLTEQPAMFDGVFSECVLEQRPLFPGGMDKAPRRPQPRPDQRELFE